MITHRDIPGENQVGYAAPDQPLLAEGKVRYHGEPVALVVAKTWEEAAEASRYVEIRYRPLPVITDPLEAMKSDTLIHA